MKKTLKLLAIWGTLYVLNNLYYWNQPEYQQHPTEAATYFLGKPDSAFAATLHYPSVAYKTTKRAVANTQGINKALRKRVLALMETMRSIENPDGDPFVVNRYGYMGKYQMGQQCLKNIGMKVSPSKMRKNHAVFSEHKQDKAFLKNCLVNKSYLEKDIKKYKGKRIKGIHMSETNIVAAGHCGVGRVSLFLRSHGRIDKKDGNGTPVSLYLKKFENHRVDFEKALTVI